MKRFGIRGNLPKGDPMALPHLLGENFEWYRWYDSQDERDKAFADMQAQFIFYRKGDAPSQELAKVER